MPLKKLNRILCQLEIDDLHRVIRYVRYRKFVCRLRKVREFYFRHLFYIAAAQQNIHLLFLILAHGDIDPFRRWWRYVRKYPVQYRLRA